MGTDIAILDSAYLLSQVVPSLFMGSIVQLFQSVTVYMACASLLSLVAVYFSSKIVFEKADIDTRWLRCYQQSNRLWIVTKTVKGSWFCLVFLEREMEMCNWMHTGNLLEKNIGCNIQQTIYGHTFT